MMNSIGGPWPRRTTTTIFSIIYVVLLRRSAARAACQYSILLIWGLFYIMYILIRKTLILCKKKTPNPYS